MTSRDSFVFRAGQHVPGLRFLSAGPAPTSGVGPVVWRDTQGRELAFVHPRADGYSVDLLGIGTFELPAREGQVAVTPRDGVAQEYVLDGYRRCILPFALHLDGLQVIHASGVVVGARVAAFAAASQTGKSTLAYALSERGHRLWADDVVAFEAQDGRIEALPVPFRIRLRPESSRHFAVAPNLKDGAFVPTSDTDEPGRLELGAVFIVERGLEMSSERLSATEAFERTLANGFFFDLEEPARKGLTLNAYLALSAQLPVYRLVVPTDLAELERVLDDIERRMAE